MGLRMGEDDIRVCWSDVEAGVVIGQASDIRGVQLDRRLQVQVDICSC